MTREELKELYIRYYAYIAVGNYDVIMGGTNDGDTCYITEGVYFTRQEWHDFLGEVREEFLKRNKISKQGTTSKI